MDDHLYIIVRHRNSTDQKFKENVWGEQGRLLSIQTNSVVIEAAEAALSKKLRVFIYETDCPKSAKWKSCISQEVRIAAVNREELKVEFTEHQLLYRKPPFKGNQGQYRKWFPEEPQKS